MKNWLYLVTLGAGVTALGIYLGLLARLPLWQVDQHTDASIHDAVLVKADEKVTQTILPNESSIDVVLLKTARLTPPGAASLTLIQDNQILRTASSGQTVADTAFTQQTDSSIAPGWWIPFDLSFLPITPGQPLQLEITAHQDVYLAWEVDETRYPLGTLTQNNQNATGNLAFATLRQASPAEALRYQLTTQNRLVIVLIITTITALLMGLWRMPDNRPLFLFLGLAILYTIPVYHNVLAWGVWDWPEAASHYAAAKHSLQAGQFPWWNPYMCGGTALWHDPQVYWPSLTFGLVLAFGAAIGTKLAITAYVALGLTGMYALTRQLQLSHAAATLGAIVFIGSGFLASHLAAGQMLWLSIAWIPWLVYFFLNSFIRPWQLLLAATLYVLIIFHGRVYITAYLFLLLPLLALGTRTAGVSWKRIAQTLGGFGILVLGLGAIKILPMFFFLQDVDTSLPDSQPLPLNRLGNVLLTRDVSLHYAADWLTVPWHEYAAYVGIVPLILALIGSIVVIQQRKRSLWTAIIISGVIFLSMATGILPLLEYLPIFNQLHNPGRAILMTVFVIALLSGKGLDWLVSRLPPTTLRYTLGLGIALFVFADLTLVAATPLANTFTEAPKQFADNESFRQLADHTDNGTHIVQAGYGARDFCSPHARLWHSQSQVAASGEDRHQGPVYTTRGIAEITLASFTPNKLTIAVGQVPEPDTLVINQKYDRGWQSPGHHVTARNGLPTIALSPQDSNQAITIAYSPPLFWWGLAITLTTIAASALWAVRYYRQAPRSQSSTKHP